MQVPILTLHLCMPIGHRLTSESWKCFEVVFQVSKVRMVASLEQRRGETGLLGSLRGEPNAMRMTCMVVYGPCEHHDILDAPQDRV
jgi:hypothetical protein